MSGEEALAISLHVRVSETTMLKELRLVIGDDYAKLEPVEQGKGVAECETTSFLIAG